MEPKISELEHLKVDAKVFRSHVVEVHRVSDVSRGWRKKVLTKTWRTERVIGRGAFGKVLLQVEDGDPGSKRVVKKIKLNGQDDLNEFKNELAALVEFSKPKYKDEGSFVEFFGWYQSRWNVYFAMEFVPLGDLESNLRETEGIEGIGINEWVVGGAATKIGAISEGEAQDIVTQILEGVCIMHAEGFSHRDLKPQNILVAQREPTWWVKLADFGLAKRRTEATGFSTRLGTLPYMAPELFYYVPGEDTGTSGYTNAIDIWAVGCIAYRVFTGAPPFPDLHSLKQYCEKKSRPQLLENPAGRGSRCVSFLRLLLTPLPTARVSAKDALVHPWLHQASRDDDSQACPEKEKTPSHDPNIYDRGKELYYDTCFSYSLQSLGLRVMMGTIEPQLAEETGCHSFRISEIAGKMKVIKFCELKGQNCYGEVMAFSANGELLASGAADCTIWLWELPKGVGHKVESYSDRPRSLAFSSNGQKLAAVSWNRRLALIGTKTEEVLQLESDLNTTICVAFAPDGKTIASACFPLPLIGLWDATTGIGRTFEGHSDIVSVLAFSPDSQKLASASQDQTIRLWDMGTGASHVLDYSVRALVLAFSPDGKLLASGSGHGDYSVILWSTSTEAKQGFKLEHHLTSVTTLAFSPDGKILASTSSDKMVMVWDLERREGAEVKAKPENHLKMGLIHALSFSLDGYKLSIAASGPRNTISYWEIG